MKKKLIIIIGILFGIALATGAVNKKIKAQDSGFASADYNFTTTNVGGYGNLCVPNYGGCNLPSSNLNKLIVEKKVNIANDWGLSVEVLTGILSQYTLPQNDLCITDVTNVYIFPFVTADKKNSNDPISNRNEHFYSANNAYIIPRVCPNGTLPMESPVGDNRTYGCCPSGYTYINETGNITGAAAQEFSGCCPILQNGGEAIDFNYNSPGQHQCMYKDTLSEGTFWESMPSGKKIITHDDNEGYIYGLSLAPGYSPLSGNVINPINDLSRSITQQSLPKIGANYICIEGSECALTDNSTVRSPLDLKLDSNKALNCNYCYNNGAPIGILENGNLGICSNTGLKETPLINNSVNDTLAWLRTDSENKDLLKACRERGGIYIFVGCVDPTPLGVITGLIRITLGVVGGVALLQLIWIGILLQSGQEKQIVAARKNLMATLTGVAVLVFSILILRIIGVNVLDILPAGSV